MENKIHKVNLQKNKRKRKSLDLLDRTQILILLVVNVFGPGLTIKRPCKNE